LHGIHHKPHMNPANEWTNLYRDYGPHRSVRLNRQQTFMDCISWNSSLHA